MPFSPSSRLRHLGSIATLVTGLSVASHALAAQPAAPATLLVEADHPAGRASPHPEVEPHLSVHPRQPRHLLVATITALRTDLTATDCTVAASFDGGRSWSATRVSERGHRSATCGDPWTAILADGTALLTVVGDSGISVFRSPDGGRSWPDAPLLLRGHFDHEMLAVDTAGGAVYLVAGVATHDERRRARYGIFVARSADGGRTFVERGRPIFSNLNYEAQVPLVLSDGTLMLSFMDHHDASDRRLERRRVWLAESPDAGRTYAAPMLVTEQCNRRGPAAWPSLAVAPPGTQHADRLYAVCEAHEHRGILFTASADRGERWTAARRVDTALPGAEDSAATGTTRNPAVAVAPDGSVALTWYDRRDDPTGRCQHLYGTVSLDGGASLLSPRRISTMPSCPAEGRNGDVAARFPGGGDYSGLVAVGRGEFLAVWADSRGGHYQLRAARLTIGADAEPRDAQARSVSGSDR